MKKNRREFISLSTMGVLVPGVASLHLPVIFGDENKKGVVKQPEDGEIYFVREKTPITIYVSRQADSVAPVSLCTEELLPASKIPIHKHLNEDEFFIFQKGTGVIEIDGAEFSIKPGTNGWVPRGTWHSINNSGSEIMIFTFGYSPAGFEDFFRKIGTPKSMPFKAKSKEESLAIAEKYGMVFK